ADALLVGEGRGLAGRSVDDDTVGAVVDQKAAKLAIAVEIDRALHVERSHGRGQHLSEHAVILRRRESRSSSRAHQVPGPTAPRGSPMTPGGTVAEDVCRVCDRPVTKVRRL